MHGRGGRRRPSPLRARAAPPPAPDPSSRARARERAAPRRRAGGRSRRRETRSPRRRERSRPEASGIAAPRSTGSISANPSPRENLLELPARPPHGERVALQLVEANRVLERDGGTRLVAAEAENLG